ncbi:MULTISPECIES: hypothetical protein [Haloferax]|uniref:Uncharacterized protein n=1 Tax=Haloferax sp. Atlit-48N TaxID=2077198 RepID=A0ACD5HWY9_9EURY|nr:MULTISPECIES: hypothetical protein [Haloferax]MBC9985441.1 hypothetical protein [Haloferax sp. AS1]RDZ33167.1 hypothetical protein DEQ67_05205 [Haloferax sp. Atlit-48N]RDZ37141.1 hypothetical protein C5B88_03355 [Haloferax sp. Atlit-24N]RLM37938.1 hypothetical protein DVK03_03355 [Haloferax sp. Atlit-109R]RLM45881.1 hypothetical protein DVK04_03370 [Haloferax sp. Atlit-105R]
MSANAVSADTSERDGTRRIDVTTVRTGRVADFAETELGDDAIGFERRGGWTYLVAKETR